MKSPIYCDNRLTLSYPKVRQAIAAGLEELIKEHFPTVEIIAGTKNCWYQARRMGKRSYGFTNVLRT